MASAQALAIWNLPAFLSATAVLMIGLLLLGAAAVFAAARVAGAANLLLFAGFVLACGLWFLVDFDFMVLFTQNQGIIDALDDLSLGFIPLFTTAYLLTVLQSPKARRLITLNYGVLLVAQLASIGMLFGQVQARESMGVFLFSLLFLATTMFLGVCCLFYEAFIQKNRRAKTVFWLVAMVFLGIGVDTLDYYLNVSEHGYLFHAAFLVALLVTLVWMLRYILENVRGAQRAAELENELLHSRISVMLSQIKPHFIFNTLNAISALCLTDPLKADETVVTFSEYLRENINALETAAPVPFLEELHHVENYAKIEKMRFGDKLQMEYDIGFTDFCIPTLTLQPIVENAIRHGIGKKQEGGTVWVTARKEGEEAVVCVRDDGVGFDMTGEYGRKDSIGMKNVKTRLEGLVHAVIRVESQEGQGTQTVIRIPLIKEGELGAPTVRG